MARIGVVDLHAVHVKGSRGAFAAPHGMRLDDTHTAGMGIVDERLDLHGENIAAFQKKLLVYAVKEIIVVAVLKAKFGGEKDAYAQRIARFFGGAVSAQMAADLLFPGYITVTLEIRGGNMIADKHGGVARILAAGDHLGGTHLSASADFGRVQMCFGFIHFVISGKSPYLPKAYIYAPVRGQRHIYGILCRGTGRYF